MEYSKWTKKQCIFKLPQKITVPVADAYHNIHIKLHCPLLYTYIFISGNIYDDGCAVIHFPLGSQRKLFKITHICCNLCDEGNILIVLKVFPITPPGFWPILI